MVRVFKGAAVLVILLATLLQAGAAMAEHISGSRHFPDVPDSHPDSRYIAFLSGKGIIGGYPDGRFGPDDPLTRAAATKIAVQTAGHAARSTGPVPDFTDLSSTHWSVPYVRAAVDEKLVTGYDDKSFRPDDPVTRAQLAALAVRATRQPMDVVPDLTLSDVSRSDWFYQAATLAVVSGMMQAPEGRFQPNDVATRAEAARAFAQAMTFTPQIYGQDLFPTVTTTRGKAEILLPGSTTWEPLTEPRSVPVGSHIRTAAASAAEVTFPDGSGFMLDNSTELILIRSRGADLIGGVGVEELEVELVQGQFFGALTPRIDSSTLEAYKGYLSYYNEDPAREARIQEAMLEQTRVRAAASGDGQNLPANATRLILFVDPAQLTPGDASGAELTIVLADEAGEPVTASNGDVRLHLDSDVGRFSNPDPVIPEGNQAVVVTIYPPDSEPEDAKTRVTAAVGDLSSALTIPTAKTSWWSSVFSKKTRATVRMPWSVASVRGSYVNASVNSQKNSMNVLGGDGTMRSKSGFGTALKDNQSAAVTSPEKPPTNPTPLNLTEQKQWNAQRNWVKEQTQRIERNAPREVQKEVRDEHQRITNLVTALPADTINPSITISSPANDTRVGAGTIVVRGAASDNVKLTSVSVGGVTANVDARGNWSATVPLRPGNNSLDAVAVDGSGNTSSSRVRVTYDAEAPSISLKVPEVTRESSLALTGSASAPGGLESVTVNGQTVSIAADGSFSLTATLDPGRNLLTAVVTDKLGRSASTEQEVTSANLPPLLSIGKAPAAVAQPLLAITGQAVAQYSQLESVTVNGAPVLFGGDGSFTAALQLKLGPNAISVTATDNVGNTATEKATVTLDAAVPSVTLAQPRDGLITKEGQITVSGTASATAGISSLTVNGGSVSHSETGAFTATVPLKEGPNAIAVELTDPLGRSASQTITVNLITKAPTLVLSQPEDGKVAAAKQLPVSGSAAAAYGPLASVTVNGKSMLLGGDGGFSTTIDLADGKNTITATAVDGAGNSTSLTRTVSFSSTAPTISLSAPKEHLVTNKNTVAISGTVNDKGAVTAVTVNGKTVALGETGGFSTEVGLSPGRNEISVSLPAEAGGATVAVAVIYAAQAPSLSVTSPAESSQTAQPEIVVSGSALTSYGTPANVSVTGLVVPVGADGGFSATLSLRPGKTDISVVAVDEAGNSTAIKRTIEYKPALPLISITAPADGLVTKEARVVVRGRAASTVGIKSVTVNGKSAAVDNSGSFSATVDLLPGPNTISVSVNDMADGASSAAVTVLRGGVPPTLSINHPSEGTVAGGVQITVDGKATPAAGEIDSVTVNGAPAAVGPDGSWVANVTLKDGENSISVVAVDSLGGSASASRKVTLAREAPSLEFAAPTDGLVTSAKSVIVSGRTKASPAIKSLTVNGASVSAGADGSFQTSVTLTPGKNTITVSVTDSLDRIATASRSVVQTSQPPVISLSAPADGATVESQNLTVRGTATPAIPELKIASVTVNGSAAAVSADGSFNTTLTLSSPGSQTVTVVANDSASNSASVRRTVNFSPTKPSLTVSSPTTDAVSSAQLTVSGKATSRYSGLKVTVNGVSVNLGADGSFETSLTLASGQATTVRVTARDQFGESTVEKSVTYTPAVAGGGGGSSGTTTPSLAVPAVSAQYSDVATLTATLTLSGAPQAGKAIGFSIDQVDVGTAATDASGKATLAYLVTNAPGAYTVKATWAGDAQVTAVNGSGTLTAARENATLSYTGATGTSGGNLSVSALVSPELDGLPGDLTLAVVQFQARRLDTGAVESTVTAAPAGDGLAETIIPGLLSTAYAIDVTLPDTSYFTAATHTVTIKTTPVLVGLDASGVYSDTAALSVTIADGGGNLAGKELAFAIDGVPEGTAASDASGTVAISAPLPLPAGTYTVDVTFAGDSTHEAASTSFDLIVLPETATLTYTGSTQATGGPLNLWAQFDEDPDDSPGSLANAGTVQFVVLDAITNQQVDQQTVPISDLTGYAATSSASLPIHPYTVEVSLISDYYAAPTLTAKVKAAPTLNVGSTSGQYSDAATLTATLTDGIGGVAGKSVSFTVAGTPVGAAVTGADGVATASYTIDVPQGGPVLASLTTADADYDGASGTGTLTVYAENGTLAYAGDLVSSGGALSLAALLTEESDASAGSLDNAGSVQFVVYNATNDAQVGSATALIGTDGNATTSITPSVAGVPYTVTASLVNSSYYAAAAATATVRAATSVAVTNAQGTYDQSTVLKATITPAVSNLSLSFLVDGTEVGTGYTDASGTATYTYQVAVAAGTPTLTASFAGDSLYQDAVESGVLTVQEAPTTLTLTGANGEYSDKVDLVARLSPALSDQTITFMVNGASQTAQTDAGGVATYTHTIAESPATSPYTVTASFGGVTSYYLGANDTASLTVNKETATIAYTGPTGASDGSGLTLTASLTDADGSAGDISLAGPVQFVVKQNGSIFHTSDPVDLLSGGTASWTTPSLGYSPPFTLEVSQVGSDYYTAAPITAAIKVTTSLALNSLNQIQYSDVVTLSATLSPTVSGRTVDFKVDGVLVGYGTTNDSGIATYAYTVGLAQGSYSVDAAFAGDANYSASTAATTLSVVPESVSVTYNGDTSHTTSGSIHLSAQLIEETDSSVGSLDVAGKVQFTLTRQGSIDTYVADVTSGGVAAADTLSLQAGTYAVTYALLTNDYYTPTYTNNSPTATVQGPTTLTVYSQAGQYSDTVSLSAMLSIDGATTQTSGQQVTFHVNNTAYGPATTGSGGVATYGGYTLNLASGTYTIQAVYAGNGGALAPATGTSTLTVSPETAKLTLDTVTPSPMTSSGPLILSATLTDLSDGQPGAISNAGKVRFTVTPADGSLVKTFDVAVTTNAVSTTTETLAQGAYTVQASLLPNNYYTAPDSSAVTVKSDASLSVTVGQPVFSDPVFSDPVTIQATLSPGVADKPIYFTVGTGASIGHIDTDANGVATTSYTVTEQGNTYLNITATFAGDQEYNAATGTGTSSIITKESAEIAWTGETSNSDTTLSVGVLVTEEQDGSLGNKIDQIPSVTFTVTGLDGTQVINPQTNTTAFPVALSGGTATASISVLSVQPYLVTVTLGSQNYYTGSLTYTVKAPTTLTVSNAASTVQYGDTVSLSATVSPAATGTVQFQVNGVDAGAPVALSGGSASTDYTVTEAPGTPLSITADYSGDSNYAGSSAAAHTIIVTAEAATLSITAATLASDTGTLSLQATITDDDGFPATDGTVTFTVTDSQATDSTTYTATVTPDGTATYTGTLAPPVGSYTVSAALSSTYYTAAPTEATAVTVVAP